MCLQSTIPSTKTYRRQVILTSYRASHVTRPIRSFTDTRGEIRHFESFGLTLSISKPLSKVGREHAPAECSSPYRPLVWNLIFRHSCIMVPFLSRSPALTPTEAEVMWKSQLPELKIDFRKIWKEKRKDYRGNLRAHINLRRYFSCPAVRKDLPDVRHW